MLCADLVNIRWREKTGRGRKATAILEDISVSGACLQLDGPIPIDTVVRIQHPKGALQGHVRYCIYREYGYFVGLHFNGSCKWSKREYQPLHLLDVNRLLGRAIRATARHITSSVIQ